MNPKTNYLAFLIMLACWLSPKQGEAQQTLGLFLNDSMSINGYTLFSVNTTTYLIDNCGHLVKTWESKHKVGLSVYLLENGDLLRAGVGGGGIAASGAGGIVEKFSWDGDLLWTYTYAGEVRQHHDIEPMPNGHVLLLAWESKSKEEAIAAGRNPEFTGDLVLPEHIVEVKPIGSEDGEIVWEWHAWDHLIQDFDEEKANYGVVADHPELFNVNFINNPNPAINKDWMHANAISYHQDRDEIAISSRHFGEIWIIDHSTTTEEAASHEGGNAQKGGDILYRWGNPQTYNRGGPQDQQFFGQHNVLWIPKGYPNEDKIIVFNNGLLRPDGFYSTVDIIDPPLNSDGTYQIDAMEAYGPTDLYWTHRIDDLSSSIMSGAQPLSNGNVLICYATGMEFKEVTQNGELVWDYIAPVGNNGLLYQGETNFGAVFRATRYETDYPAFENRTLTPSGPIELEPIPYECTIFGETVGTSPAPLSHLQIIENPVFDYLNIKQVEGRKLMIRIFNLSGQLLLEQESAAANLSISMQDFLPGLYFVHFSEPSFNGRQSVQKIVKK